jgi:putative heme transporter
MVVRTPQTDAQIRSPCPGDAAASPRAAKIEGGVPASAEELTEELTKGRPRRRLLRKFLLGGLSLGVIVATFAYFLPTIADYGAVWGVVEQMSWWWVLALLAATAVNLATFAPPWMITLPGLRFLRAMELTQASTALSIVVPGGAAVGAATSYGMTRKWGYPGPVVARAVTLTSLWNQFLNLVYPIVAVFSLAIVGEQSASLATAAFIGAAVLGIVIAGFVLVLLSDRLANDIGDVAARFANWALAKIRRKPVTWSGQSFVRFRDDVGDFIEKKWPWLTIASLAGSLTVFVVLLVSLRALDVPASKVSVVEAFAAWSLARIIGSIPVTPGGIGIVEVGLTGALIGFGGPNAGVVAAVLVFRFLTMVPTLVLGLIAAFTWRRKEKSDVVEAAIREAPADPRV